MAFYNEPLYGESVSAVTATPSVDVGSRRRSGDSEYVYVYNAGSVALWPGDSCVLSSYSATYDVTATNTASQAGYFAGGVYHATISTNYYGWIVVDGLCRVRPDTSAVSFNAGDYVVLGVDNGYSTAPATLSTSTRLGLCISSGVTNLGASGADCGLAYIKSQIW